MENESVVGGAKAVEATQQWRGTTRERILVFLT